MNSKPRCWSVTFGVPIAVDDDARTYVGDVALDQIGSLDVDAVLSHLVNMEYVDQDDITILTDESCEATPGIRLTFDLDILLGSFNQRILSKENMLGLLGSFGIPRSG